MQKSIGTVFAYVDRLINDYGLFVCRTMMTVLIYLALYGSTPGPPEYYFLMEQEPEYSDRDPYCQLVDDLPNVRHSADPPEEEYPTEQ